MFNFCNINKIHVQGYIASVQFSSKINLSLMPVLGTNQLFRGTKIKYIMIMGYNMTYKYNETMNQLK